MKEQFFTNKWSLAIIVGLIALTAFLIFQNAQRVQGSVDFEFGGYQSTSTAHSDFVAGSKMRVLKSTQGLLGSVVVTLTSNAPMVLYDSTTTNFSSNIATTTLADFRTTTAGTYTYDIQLKYGLVVSMQSAVGAASTTITWK